MERRREKRAQVDEPVLVTILSDEPSIPIQARVLNMSGKGLKISFPTPVGIGVAIKIERPGELWLGEVIYVRQGAEGYQIGIEIDQALRYSRDLERLRDAVGSLQPVSAGIRENSFVAADKHR
jgi:PilZ domain